VGDDGVCPECNGTGMVPDSIDNYVYDPYGMAPCPVCSERKSTPLPPPPPSPPPPPPSARTLATKALEEAVVRGDVEEASRQLDAGADVSAMTYARPEDGAPWIAAPLLGLAVERRDIPMIELLVARGARLDQRTLVLRAPTYDPYGEDVEVPDDTVLERAESRKDPAVLAALTRK
jgi:hypothetical protein